MDHTIGQTPTLPGKSKGEEVQAWLQENPTDAYVIIDDEPGHYLPYQQQLHLVKTNPNFGHTLLKADQAAWILKH